ncbi:MAG: hypothetical protein PUI46_04450 [Lachnospiraceae bacterium]|nr:hypothetical protein [Lachnospiraceae bacterium]
MKDTLILKDQTVLELETGASLTNITILSANKAEMVEKWDKMTKDNLSAVQVKNADGAVIGNYMDLILVSETSTILADGTISTALHLREKTDMERLEEKVEALMAGQAVQDGAISDLGTAVSDISAGGTE